MRINKYIAQAGIASRRKADELVQNGKVKVNGAVLKEPGYDVSDTDTVEVLGQIIKPTTQFVYYALNKPAGFVSTVSDEKGRPTVISLLTDVTIRVFPIGRLDYESRGLLILTNDGTAAQHVAHPKNKVWKTYVAKVNGMLNKDQLWQLRNGIEIELRDGDSTCRYTTKPAIVNAVSVGPNQSVYEIQICEGKNRQIRKMFEAVGLKVLDLQRTAIGSILLGRTNEGSYRKLNKQETDYLLNC